MDQGLSGMNYTKLYQKDLRDAQDCVVGLDRLAHKSVLVTGACGLIGSALVDFLLSCNDSKHLGITVYAGARSRAKFEARFETMLDRRDLCYFAYDATQPIETELHFDSIIHAASNANPAAYVSEPVETMMANYLGVMYALEYARKTKDTRVLFVSSSEVYGRKDDPRPYLESDYGYLDLLNPRACYPSSKRAAETLCAAYAKEYGVSTCVARPGHIYGPTATPSDNRASSQFPKDVIAGHDIVMKSAGTQIRSYCYVVDCVSAIVTVLLCGADGEAYNISNKNSVCNIREMAQAFATAGNRKLVFENASDLEKAGYNLMDNSSLNAEKLEGLGWRALFDMDTGALHTLQILSASE